MRQVLEQLSSEPPLMSLDEFLLGKDDPNPMQDAHNKISAQPARMHQPAREDTDRIENNKLMCKKKSVSPCQSKWGVELDQTYPGSFLE